MKIFIMTHHKKAVAQNVWESVVTQRGVSADDVRVVDCTFNDEIPKRQRIAKAKNKCLKIARRLKSTFIVIHDDDLLELYPDNLLTLEKFLIQNSSYGACALFRENRRTTSVHYIPKIDNHICSGVVMIRPEALPIINFGDSEYRCTGHAVGKSLTDTGFLYGYVDNKLRIEHMRQTL
jgi:hypothetical protein